MKRHSLQIHFHSPPQDDLNLRRVRELIKLPQNRKCFDCPSKSPVYANLHTWTFICPRCSGLVREFGHRVKSVSASNFTQHEVDCLQMYGNQFGLRVWLSKYNHKLPEPEGNEAVRDFMRQKYVELKWVDKEALGAMQQTVRAMVRQGEESDETRTQSPTQRAPDRPRTKSVPHVKEINSVPTGDLLSDWDAPNSASAPAPAPAPPNTNYPLRISIPFTITTPNNGPQTAPAYASFDWTRQQSPKSTSSPKSPPFQTRVTNSQRKNITPVSSGIAELMDLWGTTSARSDLTKDTKLSGSNSSFQPQLYENLQQKPPLNTLEGYMKDLSLNQPPQPPRTTSGPLTGVGNQPFTSQQEDEGGFGEFVQAATSMPATFSIPPPPVPQKDTTSVGNRKKSQESALLDLDPLVASAPNQRANQRFF
ncbi:uncharacterized protein VTP21DRAFT_713 [Calcarisporiella thermophila]|uniref:uncharacterized protein n=1 Tax=Calcarisporiella thermophila TaxID=911321 RepID=UPI0037439670